ncbi:MAG: acetyl-CoA carboxylase biotin carboxyl carrier protein [Succinatimonas sp.]|nr:acetyl-CoA carboxylase biotin carboxyl carrier protein [Succinatimonas sp.]
MDIHKISKLIEIVSKSDISEINLKQGEEELKITRDRGIVANAAPVQTVIQAAPAIQAAAPAQVAPQTQSAAPALAPAAAAPDATKLMKSPMVGTFYRSSSPTADPFVAEGQSVKEGDTLCIIEAMKMMNQVQSDRAGVIKKILVDNGSTVEFDQPLFEFE